MASTSTSASWGMHPRGCWWRSASPKARRVHTGGAVRTGRGRGGSSPHGHGLDRANELHPAYSIPRTRSRERERTRAVRTSATWFVAVDASTRHFLLAEIGGGNWRCRAGRPSPGSPSLPHSNPRSRQCRSATPAEMTTTRRSRSPGTRSGTRSTASNAPSARWLPGARRAAPPSSATVSRRMMPSTVATTAPRRMASR